MTHPSQMNTGERIFKKMINAAKREGEEKVNSHPVFMQLWEKCLS